MLADAQFATEAQAIVAGHHDVEHDQVDHIALEEGTHLPAIGRQADAQAILLQVVADQLANFPVVVDDQDVIDVVHGQSSQHICRR
ncbi:hypothetical protein FQZ97_563200 [compost metagenome]